MLFKKEGLEYGESVPMLALAESFTNAQRDQRRNGTKDQYEVTSTKLLVLWTFLLQFHWSALADTVCGLRPAAPVALALGLRSAFCCCGLA